MAIDIVPATEADAPILTPLGLLAFQDDLLMRRMENLDSLTPSQREEHLEWRIGRNRQRLQAPGKNWFKAIDKESSETVGYAGIIAPESGKPTGLELFGFGEDEMPSFVDRELVAMIEKKSKELKKEHLAGRDDYWYVTTMAVHPSHQGCGIAKQLMQSLCELADAAGQDTYLEATTSGKRLYENAGFETLGEVSVLDGAYLVTPMLRRAR